MLAVAAVVVVVMTLELWQVLIKVELVVVVVVELVVAQVWKVAAMKDPAMKGRTEVDSFGLSVYRKVMLIMKNSTPAGIKLNHEHHPLCCNHCSHSVAMCILSTWCDS